MSKTTTRANSTAGFGCVGLQQTGSDSVSFYLQIRQQVEVEKKEEVAMEMSDLVVYCQPRSKEKDRFGKDTQMLVNANAGLCRFSNP